MSYLVIVESPTKASTIKSYLGSNYKVIASKGHVRDLPKSALGVDIENGFEPHYINIRGKGDVIAQLRKEAKTATRVYLATDPDREGEAISWHLALTLGIPLDRACRVVFNEVTKGAIKEAIKKPRMIDMDLVNSQQARRILDRIVGYQLSPFLWKNVKSGLSAGRVQSVATRIICEREEEINAFVPQEYWTIEVELLDKRGNTIKARFVGFGENKQRPESEAEATRVCETIAGENFRVLSVKRAQKSKQPAPPFTTSTLQQEASRKLGFQSVHTMKIAQELYEGINLGPQFGGAQGLITYMRTDSVRISEAAQADARSYITDEYGAEYAPKKPPVYKSKGKTQDAHEAIRPAVVTLKPEDIKSKLSSDQYKLYKLIWDRFVSSQMSAAVYDTVTVDLEANGAHFRTGGYTVKFRGYTCLYDASEKEGPEGEGYLAGKLPSMKENDVLTLSEVVKNQHFTEAPARYTDASLIKVLEESGVGRPSTFATIISTIISREYVKRVGRTLVPTQLGEVTTRLMKESFPAIVDYEFTAQMEDRLDSIEHGGTTTQALLGEFYRDFNETLEIAMGNAEKQKIEVPVEESDVVCEKCGSKMVYKSGRYGKFLACPNYPTCRNTLAVDKQGHVVEKAPAAQPEKAGFTCELCGAEMVIRTGKFGEFYACSNYPSCRFTKQKIQYVGVDCPKCKAGIVVRHSRDKKVFYSCERYPDCDYSSWDMPIPESCPDCGHLLVYKKTRKTVVCSNADCRFQEEREVQVIE